MANNGSRYHAEIKVSIMGRETRINIFADTLNEAFHDLATIARQFPDQWTPPGAASRELARAQLLTGAAAPDTGDPEIPTCTHCGSWENMELVEFKSKKDGSMKRAWKCQACEEWHYPNGKKK